MSWAATFSDASIRFFELIRSPHAASAAAGESSGSLEALAGKHVLVVTFRRNGDPVPTPVWFGVDGGCVYFRSVASGHKLRRIVRNPEVLVAPCTANGRPTGPAVPGWARLLESATEDARAEAAIRRNYGLSRRLYARLIAPRVPGRYVEVRPRDVG